MAHDDEPAVVRVRRTVRRAWGDVMSIYWANAPAWRLLKSGALVFFGFFCWAGSSVLLSYLPDATVASTLLSYTRAYGFLVILWGPLTHLVVVPLVIRLRRTASRRPLRWFSRNASTVNITIFLVLVLVLGTWPIGAMTLDFQGALGGDDSPDVDPEVECEAADGTVTCLVEAVDGIDHVVVTSGDRELTRADDPPYELSFDVDETETVVGQRQFTVEVRDESGETLRRFVRTVPDVRS